MDCPVGVPRAKGVHPLERMVLSFTEKLATALSGTSVIESSNGTSNSPIGLQLTAGNQQQNAPTASHESTARSPTGPNEPTTRCEGITRPAPTARRASPTESRRTRHRHASRYPPQQNYEEVFVRPCRKPSRFSPAWLSLSGPGIKHGVARRKLRDTILSATLLSIVLAVYLTLAISAVVERKEFHILMILVLMTLMAYFCHSIIRLIMISRRIDALHNGRQDGRLRFTGYVVPREPIPVTLARDEEMADGQEMTERRVAVPPPAYGNWRSSIRINPHLIHWGRRDHGTNPSPVAPDTAGSIQPTVDNRPPSYISDDGVQYVVDLPREHVGPQRRDPSEALIHPAERNRGKL